MKSQATHPEVERHRAQHSDCDGRLIGCDMSDPGCMYPNSIVHSFVLVVDEPFIPDIPLNLNSSLFLS